MVYSQSLLARRGPLSSIWIAAYCFKKLKKTQITATDILSCIDKILQEEWDGVAYRVLAYLLLGVVRIYSRKVEYLFDDCNKVLIDIKKFVVSTNDNASTELLCASYHSITIPDRFELDAFDMGRLEDVSSEHLASHKEITLIECADWKGIGLLPSEMYDHVEFGACHNIFSTYYSPVRSVLSSHLMNFHMELRTSSNRAESSKQLQWHRFSQEECADSYTFMGSEKEPQNHVKQYGEDNETNGEIVKTPDLEVPGDGIREEVQNFEILSGNDREPSFHVKTSEDCQSDREEMMELDLGISENQSVQITSEEHSLRNLKADMENLEILSANEREPSCHVITSEDRHSDQQEMLELDLVQPENQSVQITRVKHSLRNLKADMENMENVTSSQEESLDVDDLCGAKKHQEPFCSYTEENHNEEPTKLQDTKALEEDLDALPLAYDGSPDTKQTDALGVSTPKLLAFPRPASKRSARSSRKRKCVFDDIVVLPNELIRQSIHDASDLVAKRRKVPKNAHAVWQTQQIGNLAQNVLEPLISNVSQELRSLLCRRKLRKLKITPEKLDLLDCQRTGISEKLDLLDCQRTGISEKLDLLDCQRTGISAQIEVVDTGTVEHPEDLDVLEYPCNIRLEQAGIAPDTPILHSKLIKSFHSPKSPEVRDMDLVRPETSGRIEKEPSIGTEQGFPTGNVEEVPSLDRDQENDFNLLTEEAEVSEGVNPETDGCSLRTRKVARYLHRHFTICKSRGEKQVNLLDVAERRTKKESARLFYETLVLKTIGFVDVKQADPFGDILIWKLPKWEQMWGSNIVDEATSSKTMFLCP